MPVTMSIVVFSHAYSRTGVTCILWKELGWKYPLHKIRAGWKAAAAAGEMEAGQRRSNAGKLRGKSPLVFFAQACNLSRRAWRDPTTCHPCASNQVILSEQVRGSRAQKLHAGLKASNLWNRPSGDVLDAKGIGQRWRGRKLNLEEMRKNKIKYGLGQRIRSGGVDVGYLAASVDVWARRG